MSIRSFVTLSSVLLMAWLAIAFVHTPKVRRGVDPIATEVQEGDPKAPVEAVDLTVSVSPSTVSPD